MYPQLWTYVCQPWLVTVGTDLDHVAAVVLARFLFSTIKWPARRPPHPFRTVLFGGNSLCAAHAYRVKVTPTFLRAEYLYKLFIILCLFSLIYLCIQSFIAEWICAHPVPAVDTASSFSPLPGSFDGAPSPCLLCQQDFVPSGPVNGSRLILWSSCPISRISHLSMEHWFLLLADSIRNQDLGTSCAGQTEGNTRMHTNLCIYS